MMIHFELKKLLLKPANKIIFVLLAAIVCLAGYLAVASVDYVDENGSSTIGIAAARALREEKEQWSGYVTEAVLARVLEENALINRSAQALSDDVTERNKAFAKTQGFSDIRNLINHAFCEFKEYDYYRADSVSREDLDQFYDRRTAALTRWLYEDNQEISFSEQEKQFLITRYEELETPLYYQYADGWDALLLYLPTVVMLVLFINGFLVSGIFSDEARLKADSIFFSARLGRDKAVRAKIWTGFLTVTAVYFSTVLLYSGIVLTVLGADGADCAIQLYFSNWKSFYNLTFLQDYLLAVLGGYLGNLFILFLSMLASALTRSKAFAVTIPFILLFLPSFLSGIHIFSMGLGLLPDQLLQMNTAVMTFYLYQVKETVISAVPIILILYFILWCALVPVLYQVYRRAEVR